MDVGISFVSPYTERAYYVYTTRIEICGLVYISLAEI